MPGDNLETNIYGKIEERKQARKCLVNDRVICSSWIVKKRESS